MKLHHVPVLHRERFGDHVLLRYRWTGRAPEPGQFVMVRPASTALDPFLARPFFVHDHEDETTSLLFEVRGRGTALLAEGGEDLFASAPLGRGFVMGGGRAALVGGGVWVAPLKLLSRRLSQKGIPHDAFIEVPRDAPRAYADWLATGYPGARFVQTDSTEDDPERLLGEIGELERYAAVYASGPRRTLAATKRAAEGRVPAQLALRERMACADGSCHGCAVPVLAADGGASYVRACVEGPIFAAETLAW